MTRINSEIEVQDKPSRGTSGARGEQESAGATHVAHCDNIGSYLIRWFGDDCERCRLTRGAVNNNRHPELVSGSHGLPKKVAFTLAEVLITLGIIGVVAAMTLPSLIANYKKQQYVNSLKVGYSILNNGFRTMMAEEGVDDIEDTELFAATKSVGADTDTVASEQAAAKVMEKYFQKVRLVSRADLLGKSSCEDLVGKGPRFWNLGDKSQCSGNYNMQYALPNGMTMSIYFYDECAKSSLSDTEIAAAGGKMTKWCGMIDLDINGEKGPNQWGRDGFRFVVSQSAVVPFLGKDYNIFNGNTIEQSKDVIKTHCNPKSQTSTGRSCAARIMELDDWKMKY